ncbi:hypothetical protein BDAP_001320 [Binucleata daphniae]
MAINNTENEESSTNDCAEDFITQYHEFKDMKSEDADFLKDFLLNKKWKFTKETIKNNVNIREKNKESKKKDTVINTENVKDTEPKYKSFEELLNNLDEKECTFEYKEVQKEDFGLTMDEICSINEAELEKKIKEKYKISEKESKEFDESSELDNVENVEKVRKEKKQAGKINVRKEKMKNEKSRRKPKNSTKKE